MRGAGAVGGGGGGGPGSSASASASSLSRTVSGTAAAAVRWEDELLLEEGKKQPQGVMVTAAVEAACEDLLRFLGSSRGGGGSGSGNKLFALLPLLLYRLFGDDDLLPQAAQAAVDAGAVLAMENPNESFPNSLSLQRQSSSSSSSYTRSGMGGSGSSSSSNNNRGRGFSVDEAALAQVAMELPCWLRRLSVHSNRLGRNGAMPVLPSSTSRPGVGAPASSSSRNGGSSGSSTASSGASASMLAGVTTGVPDFGVRWTLSTRALLLLLNSHGQANSDGRMSLFDVLYNERRAVSMPLSLAAFPRRAQMFFAQSERVADDVWQDVETSNVILYTEFLQSDTLYGTSVMVDVLTFYLFWFLHHPIVHTDALTSTESEVDAAQNASAAAMWLRSFDTTMQSQEKPKTPLRDLLQAGHNIRIWITGNLYLMTFEDYLQLYLPSCWGADPSSAGADWELFLRLIIDLWLEQTCMIRTMPLTLPDFDGMAAAAAAAAAPHGGDPHITPGRSRRLSHAQPEPLDSTRMSAATAAAAADALLDVQLHGGVAVPTPYTMQCLYILVAHVLSDRDLPQHLDSLRMERLQDRGYMLPTDDDMEQASAALPLPPVLKMLQQPLFDFLRVIFSFEADVPAVCFSLAVEIWLLWMQPWILHKKGSQRRSSSGSGSRNSATFQTPTEALKRSAWTSYVLSNFHFYSALFLIFTRQARRLKLNGVLGDVQLRQIVQIMMFQSDQSLRELLADCACDLTSMGLVALNFAPWTPPDRDGGGAEGRRRRHIAGGNDLGGGEPGALLLSQFETDTLLSQHNVLYPSLPAAGCYIPMFDGDAALLCQEVEDMVAHSATRAAVRSQLDVLRRHVSIVFDVSESVLFGNDESANTGRGRGSRGRGQRQGTATAGDPAGGHSDGIATTNGNALLGPESALYAVEDSDLGRPSQGPRDASSLGGHARDSNGQRVSPVSQLYDRRGNLTPYGRAAVFSGRRKLDARLATRVAVAGDPLHHPVCSFELSLFIPLLVWISCRANRVLHLPLDPAALQERPKLFADIRFRAEDTYRDHWLQRAFNSYGVPINVCEFAAIGMYCRAQADYLVRTFRINLRFLANIRFWVGVAICFSVLVFVVAMFTPVDVDSLAARDSAVGSTHIGRRHSPHVMSHSDPMLEPHQNLQHLEAMHNPPIRPRSRRRGF